MDSKTIQAKLHQTSQAKIKNYPCNNVRASEIGHPCERYIVLSITNWEDKKPYDATLQNIFDLGNALESEVIRRLKEAGFELLTGSKNFKIAKPLITGREDIMLKDPETGELYPCEIKGLSPIAFDKINSVEDMMRHKAYYIRKYPAQLQIYMFNFNKEKGFFLLFNKLTGQIKVIEVALDYEYTERLLQKSERIYEHISAGTLPDCVDDESICSECPLLHICGAKIDRGEAVIDTGELEELLQRREQLQPLVKELEEVKEQITAAIGDADKVFTASYMVDVKTVTRNAYTIEAGSYRRQTIKRIV